MRLESWYESHVGKVRKTNQDWVGSFPELKLFVVADGMGGREGGEIASRMAVDTLHESLAAAHAQAATRVSGRSSGDFLRNLFGVRKDDAAAAEALLPVLREAVELANARIYAAGQERVEETGAASMGTTIVALLCPVEARRVVWAHVGDSRLYLFRGGQLTLLTADHTVFGEAFRDAAEIPSSLPHTNRLIRALGIQPHVAVSSGMRAVEPGDLFLLCSDGVSGMVEPEGIRQELAAARPPQESLKALIEKALDAGGKDNASALLVRVSEA